MKVYIKDLRKAKMCASGARRFFMRHGLDWSEFVKDGLDEQVLLRTNDAMARQVVEVARGK